MKLPGECREPNIWVTSKRYLRVLSQERSLVEEESRVHSSGVRHGADRVEERVVGVVQVNGLRLSRVSRVLRLVRSGTPVERKFRGVGGRGRRDGGARRRRTRYRRRKVLVETSRCWGRQIPNGAQSRAV